MPSLSSWPPVRSGPIEERSDSRQIAPIDIKDGGRYLGRALPCLQKPVLAHRVDRETLPAERQSDRCSRSDRGFTVSCSG